MGENKLVKDETIDQEELLSETEKLKAELKRKMAAQEQVLQESKGDDVQQGESDQEDSSAESIEDDEIEDMYRLQ